MLFTGPSSTPPGSFAERLRLLFSKCLGLTNRLRACHVCVGNPDIVRSVTLGEIRWYASLAFLEHPDLVAGVVLWSDRPVPVAGDRCRFLCVADVRERLSLAGIRTRWCLTPAALHRQLKDHPNAEPVPGTPTHGGGSDPGVG